MLTYSTSFEYYNHYYDAEEAFEQMAKIGYTACDVNLQLRKEVMGKTDEKRVQFLHGLSAIAKKYGIRIGQTHGGFFFFTDCYDEAYIEEYIKLKQEEILATAALECPYLVVHPLFFSGWERSPDPERAKAKNIEILQRLCTFAEQYGVYVALENMPGVPQRDIPCSTAQDLADHIDGVASPNVCACLDFGHANISVQTAISPNENSMTRYIEILGKKIRCVHVHDNTGIHDLHSLPLSPHFGGIDWSTTLTALKNTGYQGTFNSEIEFAISYPKHLFLECEKLQIAVLKEIAKPLE